MYACGLGYGRLWSGRSRIPFETQNNGKRRSNTKLFRRAEVGHHSGIGKCALSPGRSRSLTLLGSSEDRRLNLWDLWVQWPRGSL